MRRSLVLTQEGRRHPFRANLPALLPRRLDEGSSRDWTGRGANHPALTARDVRGFVNAYLAALAAALVFLI